MPAQTGAVTTRRDLLALGMAIPVAGGSAASPVRGFKLSSPSKRIELAAALDAAGRPGYSVAFDRKTIIQPSALGFDLGAGGMVAGGFRVAKAVRTSVDRQYDVPAGKTRRARDRYNQLRLLLEAGEHRLELTFRAYDDGVAFRYRLQAPQGNDPVLVTEELTEFVLAGDWECWCLNLMHFGTGHEGEFHPLRRATMQETDLYDVPVVCQSGDVVCAIAEADLVDYAGMCLRALGDGRPGVRVRLSPRLDDPTVAVRIDADTDLVSPWRVLMIADSPGGLIESTLIANLNPASAIDDTGWIKAGKYAWDWWSDDAVPEAGQHRKSNASIGRLIDFAAATDLQYMLIDAGWYVANGDDLKAGDVMRSIPGVDLPALVAYAGQRNIGLFVWVHWKALDAQMDAALHLYQRLGLAGIKVDFMDRDDQDMVAFYHRLLEAAARHRLMVDLHGAYPPTGLSRTWPNLLTQEGVMGAEYNKWSARVTATHNVTLPFTRMLLGPMDYTPGGFRNVAPQDFVARHRLPLVQTTRGQALAMYVVYESPFQAVADSPDAYLDQPGVAFMRAVPATWDETRCIAGEIGAFVVIARRSGAAWFVGAMTNEAGRTVTIPLTFLGGARFAATVYSDGDTPTAIVVTERVVGRGEAIALRLAPSGGGAIRLVPR